MPRRYGLREAYLRSGSSGSFQHGQRSRWIKYAEEGDERASGASRRQLFLVPQPEGLPVAARPKSVRTGRSLAELLECCAVDLWPFCFLNDVSDWLEEGSKIARLTTGIAAGAGAVFLASANLPHLGWLGNPVFRNYGLPFAVLIAGLTGVIVLPMMLSKAIAFLTRVLVCVSALALAGGFCYVAWTWLMSVR